MKKILIITTLVLISVFINAQNTSPYWSLAGNSNATSASKLGTTNATNLRIVTNNLERMRVTTAGNIGVGTITPQSKFHFSGALTTDWATTFYHYNASFAAEHRKKVWLRRSANSSMGDYLTLNSSGNRSNTRQSAIVLATNGIFVGRGRDDGSGLSEEWARIDQNGDAQFNGDVNCNGTFSSSDKNIKKNIEDVGEALSIIKKLKPKNYEFRDDGKLASLHLPKGRHYGLLAQELEEVLPNLVKESRRKVVTFKPEVASTEIADGKLLPIADVQKESINVKAVNYVELIPIIIKGMQEQEGIIERQNATIEKQNETIEKQNFKIEALTQLVNKLSQNNTTVPSVKLNGASLGECTPNPSNNSARIKYSIADNSGRAELVINNSAGQKIRQIRLNNSGVIHVDTSALSAGTYFYTLYLNSKSVDTKKMIVSR